MAGLQQHVVGHVDQVGDGAYPAVLQAQAHSDRTGRNREAGDEAGRVARTSLGVVDANVHGDPAGQLGNRRVIAWAQARVEVCGQLARDAQVRQGVGTVGRDVHLQHVVHHTQVLGHLGAGFRGGRQDQDPVSLFCQSHLELAADHAWGKHTADLASIQGVPAGQARTGRGPAYAIAGGGHVGCPTDHALLALACTHAHDAQLVRVRVRLDVQHLGHQHPRQLAALGYDTFDLQTLSGQRLGHGLEIGACR